jgi:hypothetical protein
MTFYEAHMLMWQNMDTPTSNFPKQKLFETW